MGYFKDLLNYQLDKIKEYNTTGAAVGAISESLINQAATGIKHGAYKLQSYIKDKTKEPRRYNQLPELNAAKSLFMEYASNHSMMGSERVKYKGIEFTIEKTEDELCLDLKSGLKNVKISSPLENKELSQLELELEDITKDLLSKVDWLTDPATMTADMHNTLYSNGGKDNKLSYSVDYKKFNGKGEINYAPDKQTGIRLNYTILPGSKMEDN